MDYQHSVPANIEAEKNVLGSVFYKPENIEKIYDLLNPEDFYDTRHSNLYRAMRVIRDKGGIIDIVTVADVLDKKKKLSLVGGASYMAEITNSTISPDRVANYCQIVKEKAALRRLQTASGRITEDIRSGKYEDPEELQQKILEAIEEVNNSSADKIDEVELIHVSTKQREALDVLQNKNKIAGIPTGIPTLDKIWRGMDKGDLIIIGGQTGHGKSMLMQRIALNAALVDNPVLYLSLEMTVAQQVSRFYSMSTDDFKNPVETVNNLPIYFYGGKDNMNLKLLEKLIKSSIEKHGVKMCFVDHLHYFSQQSQDVASEIGLIVRTIKGLAVKYDIPICVISTLRKINSKKALPNINDLKDSVMIGFDADIIAMAYRDVAGVTYEPDELYVDTQKNRPRGGIGKIMLRVTENYNLVDGEKEKEDKKAEEYRQSRSDLYGD